MSARLKIARSLGKQAFLDVGDGGRELNPFHSAISPNQYASWNQGFDDAASVDGPAARSPIRRKLRHYYVHFERDGQRGVFECRARDEDHAYNQACESHPTDKLLDCFEIETPPQEKTMKSKTIAEPITTPPETNRDGSDVEAVPAMRLSESHKQAIWAEINAKLYAKRQATTKADYSGIAELILADVMLAAHRKIMAKLPDDYFPTVHNIQAQVSGTVMSFELAKAQRVPYRHTIRHVLATYDGSHPIAVKIEAIGADERKLKEEITATVTKFRQVIATVSTLRRLIEVWPGVRPYIPVEWMDKPKSLVPVDAIHDLDKLLGKK